MFEQELGNAIRVTREGSQPMKVRKFYLPAPTEEEDLFFIQHEDGRVMAIYERPAGPIVKCKE